MIVAPSERRIEEEFFFLFDGWGGPDADGIDPHVSGGDAER